MARVVSDKRGTNMQLLVEPSEVIDMALAVSYLRVSTKAQAHRGGRDEGYSIPDQRKAVDRKSVSLHAVVVAEFIDPGESAKTRDKRKSLNEMMEFIREHNITYCIIPKLDRIARNRLDDALIHAELRAAGVKLVSVAENIDETPAGMLTHGIMASIAEFYSLNLAMEVTKGLRTKATTGGTINKAPIGYLNVQTRTETGYELRTVVLDPQRAPLIKWAFESYATGEWTLSSLLEELTMRGLTSAPTPKRPARPIHLSTLARTLQNPYYKGTIIYDGASYDGLHEPLASADVGLRCRRCCGRTTSREIGRRCTTTTSRARCSARAAGRVSSSPTRRTGTAASTRTSCARGGTASAQVTYRLDAASASYAEAQEELADCLDLASDCYSVYQQAPDAVRRLFNQAFFERIYITDDGDVQPEVAQPFAALAERASDMLAVAQEKRTGNAQTLGRTSSAGGLNVLPRVDLRGLEPLTPCMPCRCATSCATGPDAVR